MQMARVVVNWSGLAVKGLAVNVLHYAADEGPPNPAAIKTAYQAIAGRMPVGQTVTIPDTGEVFEDTTGELLSVWTGTGGGVVTGTANGNAAAGVGACISWKTGGIIAGRRLRGRTFISPLSIEAYDLDGTLTALALGSVVGCAAALRAAGPLGVWHRPTTPGGSDGNSYGVVGHSVADRASYLSSRKY